MTGDRRVYSADELMLFRRIFESAVASLPATLRNPDNCGRIARNILDCAATGERDPAELRVAAMAERTASAA